MTKTRSTKKALLLSAFSLLICFSMLIGTTFAWFTDSVTSANNIIKSGNLDVELYYQVEGQDWAKVTETTNVFKENALWEPGHTEVVKLKVVNEGTLALKYQLGVNVASEVGSVNVNDKEFKLSEYIKFGIVDGAQTYTRDQAIAAVDATATALKTAYNSAVTALATKNNGNTDEKIVTMVVYMPTTVGNEANYKQGAAVPTIKLGINLVATQYTAESDSFGSDYDKNATYPAIKTETAKGDDTITAGEVAIKLPTGAANADYTVKVDNKVVNTTATGDTTVSFDIELLKDGVKVESATGVSYPVSIYVGENLNVTGVTHKGTAVANWEYDSAEGVISFETDSFSPFAVSYFSAMVETVADIKALIEKGADLIVLDTDIQSVDGIIITDKNLTIDLNGKTFTVSEGASTNNRNFKINGASEVTIKNGTMVAAGTMTAGAYGTIRTEGTAKVTLDNVKLYNYRGNGLNVKALSGTTVTINNTEIYSQYGGGVEAAGGIVELNNVKIDQKGMWSAPYNSMAISVNGGGKATVNSGTYTTECLTAEEANNQGSSHGPWTVGVLNSGGTLVINGGTFSNDNFGDNSLATYARGLVLADTAANVVINGGTFNAVKAIVDVTNNLGDATRNPSVTLSGGTFTADPKVSGLYASHLITVADGYEVVVNDDGTYAVSEIKDILVSTFDELKAAIAAGGKIKLVNDIEVSETIAVNAEAVLKLNGYNITAGYQAGSTTKHLYPLDVYGTLTIMGDGSISGRGIFVQEGSKLILEGGSIYGIDSNGGSAIFQYGGDVIVNGGHIEQKAEGTYNFAINGLGGTVTVNGGWIGGNHGAIATESASVIINGGELVCTGTSGMTDNVLYSYSNGSIVINGGSFTADNDGPAGGCCIYDANGKVTVNGGTFGNSSGGDVWGTTGTTIKGGTFENLIEIQHIADGYEAVSNADGSVTITKK